MKALSQSDRETLNRAIADAEARTHTHLALVVVPASDRYFMYPLAYGAFLALVTGSAWALLWPQTLVGPVMLGEALVFIAFSLVFDWLPLRLLLVPPALKRARARNLAHREFAARILTTHRGGVLLFASLAEHYVELLADRDLHARVGQEAWDHIVGTLTRDVKYKPLCDCLLDALASCTAAIATEGPDVD
jgi:putative membrane protein